MTDAVRLLFFVLFACSCGSSGESHSGSIRLLDRSFESTSVQELGVQAHSLSGQRRFGLGGPTPHRFSFSFEVPAAGKLHFGLGQKMRSSGSVPVTVTVKSANAQTTLLESEIAAEQEHWQDQVLDLSAFEGQSIQLEFTTGELHGQAEGEPSSAEVFWSELFVESGELKRPNIVFFLIDTLKADHLGCYGYERDTSPTMDLLASEGVRFDNAISAAPWTDPSILALFTGLYPSDVWNPGPHKRMIRKVVPEEVTTLAETLANAGYYTIAASDHPGIRAGRFGAGFDVFSHLFAGDEKYTGWKQTPMGTIRGKLQSLIQDRPQGGVFLYVHLIYPHQPHNPPKSYRTMFGPAAVRTEREEREGVINLYDAEIRRTDDFMKVLLADFALAGLTDDMILSIVSDHGEGFWEHGNFGHGKSLFNELLRVPFILRAPGRLPAGVVVNELVSHVDLFPTLLDLADVPSPGTTRGTSLVPFALNQGVKRRVLLSEFAHSEMIRARSLQSLEEKLIYSGPGKNRKKAMYFDLENDPDERNDLSAKSEVKSRIANLVDIFPPRVDRSQGGFGELEPSEEMIDSLNALGYD